jgi:Bacterial SH3 domain
VIARFLVVLALAVALGGCGGSSFTITPRADPSATPTEDPAPTRTPRPPPTPSHTPVPAAYYVANTGGDGAVLRASPGRGDRVTSLAEGQRVVPQGEEQDADGKHWLRVQEPTGKVGWIAAELLAATPVPTRTPAPRR